MQLRKECVIDKEDLDEKISKLTAFIFGDIFKTLNVDDRSLLEEQCDVMRLYSKVLGIRIALFSKTDADQIVNVFDPCNHAFTTQSLLCFVCGQTESVHSSTTTPALD